DFGIDLFGSGNSQIRNRLAFGFRHSSSFLRGNQVPRRHCRRGVFRGIQKVRVMAVELLGRKIGMTQVYGEDGNAISVTGIEAGPCTVLQIRTSERDGYSAVQLGFGEKPRRLATRSERGHVAAISSKRSKARADAKIESLPKADCEPPRFIREFRLEGSDAP